MNVATLIKQASDAGIALRLVDGKLKAIGKATALALLADQIRAGKTELIGWLTNVAANEPSQAVPVASAADWRVLDQAYQAHHWTCHTCQAAGRGKQSGLRCGTGSALWTAYQPPI